MQLSETVKLYLTRDQRSLVIQTMDEYIRTVNSLVSDALNGVLLSKYTSADVTAELPSAVRNQCIRDAGSIVRKYSKELRKSENLKKKLASQGKPVSVKEPAVPVLKRPCCYINNQNFKVRKGNIEFPVMISGKSKRLSIRTKMTEKQRELFEHARFGTMRIVFKGDRIVAQIVYEVKEPEPAEEGNIMGIDLGIKCPAVSYTSDGGVRFYGNGRKNKYMRRYFAKKRKDLQKARQMKAVRRINDKEQRIMKDIDHKISRQIVDTAVSHDVKVIKMERLENVRSATRTSRKNNRSLHSWSFYRLSQFVEYKARLAGIKVEYVNPAYTSQKCPVCGRIHHAQDRNYVCECGFRTHRDLLGAMNICSSTEYIGGRKARYTAQGAIGSAL